jgi:hypothetical protein
MVLGAHAAAEPAGGTAELRGRITDIDERAVEGARVFAYDDADVRRPANFISLPTDNSGGYRLVLVPGTYWLVARSKKGEEYGPLMPGDKHSGDPVIVDLAAGMEREVHFTVVDLKDARRARTKDLDRPVRISGKIVDEKGAPVPKAYALAWKGERPADFPDYLSAWTDADGRYALYLPRGSYALGCAAAYPPGRDFSLRGEMVFDADATGIDLVLRARKGK